MTRRVECMLVLSHSNDKASAVGPGSKGVVADFLETQVCSRKACRICCHRAPHSQFEAQTVWQELCLHNFSCSESQEKFWNENNLVPVLVFGCRTSCSPSSVSACLRISFDTPNTVLLNISAVYTGADKNTVFLLAMLFSQP